MKADRVEISRDEQGKKWLIRIQVGAEVIRRPCSESANADEESLRRAAAEIAADEGYSVTPSEIVVSK